MADDLIDFDVIEGQKENIQALPSGRSAKALAQLYSPPLLAAQASPDDQHAGPRAAFEKELASIDEADDPLDVYDRYVRWTLDAYPSAQATAQSRLLPLLEGATGAFLASADYKNDPRYLKMWLHYIRLFHDAPREAFVFLARHGIGEHLALYYEEFAAWLETAGRWRQAAEMYALGLEKAARPAERLARKFAEFQRRQEAQPQPAAPSSPALPTRRPALAAKPDPSAPSASPAQQAQATASTKPRNAKMPVFADPGPDPGPAAGSSAHGWLGLGSLAGRKKENAREPKPWAGETLPTGKTNGGMPKMAVFRDQSTSTPTLPRHLSTPASAPHHAHQCVFNRQTGRMECVFVKLEAVYPEPGDLSVEYCFEELRARSRGWLDQRRQPPVAEEDKRMLAVHGSCPVDLDSPKQPERQAAPPTVQPDGPRHASDAPDRGFTIFEDAEPGPKPQRKAREAKISIETSVKTLSLNDENDENTPPSKQDADLAKKLRREERQNRTRKIRVGKETHIRNETQTVKLNMDSPQSKPKRRKSVAPEPTMTIATREAMEEVYGIFNQPLQAHRQTHEPFSDQSSEDEDDYTTDGESTASGKLSAAASEYGDETRNELLGTEKSETDADQTDVSTWSEFTSSKHVPRDETEPATQTSAQITTHERCPDQLAENEDVPTPVDEDPRTEYVPLQPEDSEPPGTQLRDMRVIPNHRLPFMTPIAEQTESSLGGATQRAEEEFFGAKTPSRKNGMPEATDRDDDDDIPSSPFDDAITDLPPIRTKSTRGMLKLGQGTAKSQRDAQVGVPVVAETVQKGPIVKDTQCNPMDPNLRQTILSQMRPSLSSFEGYYEHLDISSGKTAEIKKWIKSQAMAKNSQSQGPEKTVSAPPAIELPHAQGRYTVKRELGAGTFAPVYLVENSAAAAKAEEDVLRDENAAAGSRVGKTSYRKPLEAIKMEDPPSTWEFYILRATHSRLGVSRAAESVVRAHEMHLFRDECFLVEEYRDRGTLLDLVNIARVEGGNGGMDEMLAMFFAVELLRVTEAMHARQLIHGDLKGDNVLVRFDEPDGETDWNATYFPSGAHGWSSKGICLIDFGRGVDMRQFLPHVGFLADWKTSEADCAEMRELRPWTYQVDYHGLAGIIHSMLFGKYMETVGERRAGLGPGPSATSYRIRDALKRYWQTDIWSRCFDLLLNPLAHVEHERGGTMPVVQGMRDVRARMEDWLEENCERGVGLKAMIARMEYLVKEKKRRSGRGG